MAKALITRRLIILCYYNFFKNVIYLHDMPFAHQISIRILFFLLIAACPLGAVETIHATDIDSSSGAARVYRWSVVPQFNPTRVHRDWQPFLHELEAISGLRFKLLPADSFSFFEGGIRKRRFDFIYANPYQTLLAHDGHGYTPLIRDEDRSLTGILVVRKDSPVQQVQELDGGRIAFAAPNAFAVSLYMRALLSEKFGIHFVADYVGSHSNAYRKVLLGRDMASGGIYRTLNRERPEVIENLRIIYEAPSTIAHAISALIHLPQSVRDKVRQSILAMAETERGRELLKPVFLPQPVAADYERDYAPLKQLKLGDYVVWPGQEQ
jgi:phosphonate transport system substrate-binding protein